jgi:F-type H+-transporting ATPase subunit b
MQIDWFTWAAQIVNFLVLVALLKHFLYGRILDVIDKRDQELQTRWDRAEEEKAHAEQDRRALQSRQNAWDAERDNRLQEAREHANQKRRELLRAAREEVEQSRRQWFDNLERDRDRLAQDLRQVAGDEVLSTVSRMLEDLAEVSLEHQVVQAFERRLTQSDLSEDEDEKPWLQGVTLEKDVPVVVTSSFPLEPSDRERLEETIHQQRGRRQTVEFQQSEDLVLGLTVEAGAERLAWTAADYLERLRQGFHEALHAVSREAATAQAESQTDSDASQDRDSVAQDETFADVGNVGTDKEQEDQKDDDHA